MDADDTVIGSPAIQGEDLPHSSRWLTMDGTTDDLGAWQVEALAQRNRAEKAEALRNLATDDAAALTQQALVERVRADRAERQNRELRELVEEAIALAERGTWLPNVERLKQRLADIDKEER